MKASVEKAINDQIQAEFQSAYIYLSMSARFEELNFKGAAQWMRMQWQEETVHALKLFDFLLRRGGSPLLQQLDAPMVNFDRPIDAFEQSLAHEQHVTRLIHGLYELAVEEKDYSLQTLLHWFIDEQVEEEEAAEEIIQSLKLAGDTGEGLFLIDRELGLRQSEEGGE
jgi:ferritin